MKKEKKKTGYPSIDKPWLNYYCDDAINTSIPKGTIYEYLCKKNKDQLDDVAIIYFNRKITYGELFENIEQTALAFSAVGVRKGDIVAVALPNIPENIYCIYALNKLGAIANMIDLRSKSDQLIHYLNESKIKTAVITDLFCRNFLDISEDVEIKNWIIASPFDSFPLLIRKLMKIKNRVNKLPNKATSWKTFIEQSLNAQAEKNICGSTDSIACIFHTSGTTGTPKGVMMTNRNFNAMAVHVPLSGLRFDYGKRIMNQVPPFLAFNAVCSMHLPFAQHMQMVLLPEYRPDLFAENIVKTKATCCLAGPADWGNFLENSELREKDIDLSIIVSPISGSDAMSLKVKEGVNEFLKSKGCDQCVLEGYGMTEIGSAACCNLPHMNVDSSVGIPLPFNIFCIYDNDNNCELPYGVTGEICMAGPTVMAGYYNDPEETKNVLKKHSDGIFWLHSGDLGHIDENGCVYIDGRVKRMIVRHDGIKVSPFSIEKTIMKNEKVSACCVVGKEDKLHGRGRLPVAFIVLEETSSKSVESIERLCRSELSENYRPSEIIIVSRLPLTENGKIDYQTLEKQVESNK